MTKPLTANSIDKKSRPLSNMIKKVLEKHDFLIAFSALIRCLMTLIMLAPEDKKYFFIMQSRNALDDIEDRWIKKKEGEEMASQQA